jgi:phage-related protein
MATDLGQAYVQIIPSAKGISGKIAKVLDPEATSAGESAGKKTGSSFGRMLRRTLAAAGIGKIIKDAITAGGDLEQSLGGIETLFKDSADKVIGYAEGAYKTAGVSANDYMQNVTSFSASLLQSMAGDTEGAADVAHTAMVDMADNANKMGTSMQDIQNAYQGFAKQNYTMLDNLKLGYGGTKTEMERLLKDAQKLTGVKYDIQNLDDVFMAIHAIQEELEITGTTAIEAEQTLTGSAGMMKASWQNLLAEMALGNSLDEPLANLTESIITFGNNLLPMVANIISQLPTIIVTIIAEAGPTLIETGAQALADIITGLAEALPTLIPVAVEAIMTIVTTLIDNIPLLIDAALQLIQGLAEGLIAAIPVIVEKIPEIIDSILDAIVELLPLIIEAGIELFVALIEALPEIISTIVAALPKIIDSIVDTLIGNIDKIIQAGVDLLIALVENLPLIISTIMDAMPKIINGIIDALINNIDLIILAGVELLMALIKNLPKIIVELAKRMPEIIIGMVTALGKGIVEFVKVGGDLIKGLWKGIKDAGAWLWGKISGFFSGVVNRIKGWFGIKSPSKLFSDDVGRWIPAGLAEGIEDNLKPVSSAMDEMGNLATRSFESELAFNAVGSSSMSGLDSTVGAAASGFSGPGSGQPVYLTLSIAGHNFVALVEDITKLQDRTVDLALAYS